MVVALLLLVVAAGIVTAAITDGVGDLGGLDDLDAALGELKKLEARFESRKRKVVEELPFFSLNLPLEQFQEAAGPEGQEGHVIFNFFEPRYVMMAGQIEEGSQIYGYVDAYPPRPGGLGSLVSARPGDVGDGTSGGAFHWLGPRSEGPVRVIGRRGPRFRVVSVKMREAPGPADQRGAALYFGKVALLDPEDEPAAKTPAYSTKRLLASALLSMGVVVEEDDLPDEEEIEQRPFRSASADL